MKRITKLSVCFIAGLAIATMPGLAFGQLDGGGVGGDIGGGDLAGDIFDAVDAGGGVGGAANTGGTTGGTTGTGNSTGGSTSGPNLADLLGDDFGTVEVPVTPNARDIPFVGTTVFATPESRLPFRHVGPIRDTFGDAATTGTATPPNAGGGGPGTTQNGFSYQRAVTPVRSRIVPRFNSRPIAPAFVSNQINQRLNSLPTSRQFGNAVNVSMQGRTAVISGSVRSQQDARRLSRQLRLEPGVSRVRNQVRVIQ